MGSIETASTRLELLSPRPPTPPRESRPDSQASLKSLLARRPADARSSLSTPPSAQSDALSSQSSSARRKKVEFSAHAEYKDPPTLAEGPPVRQNPTPVSAPSSTSSRPIKSILKVTYGPSSLGPCHGNSLHRDETHGVNIVAMLDSTIQQLAGADRSSKLDAYMMLVRALKTSNNLPDRFALQGKMSLFMQFLQRDITARTPSGSLDSSLVNHALTLLLAFLHLPGIASTLTGDFGIFIIDHCTRSFRDPTTPKDVARHLMQVVALQNFPPKVMSAERVRCLVTALHKIEDHITGKSVIMSRILIYKHLVKQCKQQMSKHSDWVLDMFTDMLSSMKEIRSAAISLGLEAAYSLGREKPLSPRVLETFKLAPEGETYIDFYTARLSAMTRDKEQIQFVPQIWSVIILLVRDIDRWDHFNPWLALIQECFNSRDHHARHEANFAWNRLVYSLCLDERPFPKTAQILSGALASQLKRRSTGKAAEDLRRVVLGGVCNLFYYTFRPNANMKYMTTYWDDALSPIIQQFTTRQPEDRREHLEHASAILTGLFDCYTQRLWTYDRVASAALIKPDELPPIDAKWLRQNAKRVLHTVGPILEQGFLDLPRADSATHKLWKTLVGAVASAASKEVKVSQGTASFMAAAFSFMAKIWAAGVPDIRNEDLAGPQRFLESMREFMIIIISSLGVLPFTETKLSRDQQSTFAPLDTPSHRSAKGHGHPRAAVQHLFSTLSSLPPGVSDDQAFSQFLRSVFAPFFDVKNDKGRVELALELMQLAPAEALCPFGTWSVLAERIEASFDQPPGSHHTSASSSDSPVGHEYREVVKVLDRGLKVVPNLPWADWQKLFRALSARVKEETGAPGLAICVIEPLAKSMLEIHSQGAPPSRIGSNAAIELLRCASHPRDRQALDSARRRLWGTSIAGPRSTSFDPFDNLYKLVDQTLRSFYKTLEVSGTDGLAASLLNEVGAFLSRSSADLFLPTLAAVQDGVSIWVQDEDTLLGSRLPTTAVVEATKNLWDSIGSRLGQTSRPRDLPLAAIETLLCAAFESKHRHVVNSISMLWNGLYDGVEKVSYPERLKAILLERRSFVDLVLPGLEGSSLESGAQQPAFIDSQEDMNMLATASIKTGARTPSRPPSASPRSPHPPVVSLPPVSRPTTTPTPGVRRPLSRTPGPRLRHDDSQIHFTAVAMHQEGDAEESQVLTDHQRDVRERQRENAALFPEIRSSPAPKARSSVGSASRLAVPVYSPEKLPEHPRATTPDGERHLGDYIACTPTPRRGQSLPIPDNDPPSSPPELRRNPLQSEISSRSEQKTVNWEEMIASSPPMSPVAAQLPARELSPILGSGDEVAGGETQDSFVDAPVYPSTRLSSLFVDGCVDTDPNNDGLLETPLDEANRPLAKALAKVDHGSMPATPKRRLRSTASQETHKSENDTFTDALASPAPRTPKPPASKTRSARVLRSQGPAGRPNEESFLMSEIDEQSMLRLVVELDGGKAPPSSMYQVVDETPPSTPPGAPIEEHSQSPAVEPASATVPKRVRTSVSGRVARADPSEDPVLDCITVQTSPLAMSDSSSQGSVSRSRRNKRKRSLSAMDGQGGKEKRHRSEEAELELIPNSQIAQIVPERFDDFLEDAVEMSSGAEGPTGEGLLDGGVPRSPLEEGTVDDAAAGTPSPLAEEDSMEVDSADGTVDDDDDERPRSQLALEEEAASQRKTRRRELGLSSPVTTRGQVAAAVGVDVRDMEAGNPSGEAGKPSGEDGRTRGSVDDVLRMLRGGLDALCAANLARDDVSKVEDLCMDIKRELYEAERRGRR